MIMLKTDEAMIQAGHHWLFLHTKVCQEELVAFREACEFIFEAIDDEMGDYDEAPPQWMTDAYLKLFELLDKAPEPEDPDPSGGELPL